jgi:hypothetical protein
MKRTARVCIVLLWAAPALAGPATDSGSLSSGTVKLEPADVTEIRLGTPADSGPATSNQDEAEAVEAFLAARQAASADRSLADRARSYMRTGREIDSGTLFGSKGASLVAFDYKDEAIEFLGPDRFRVVVSILFADSDGHVEESRDESLTFSGAPGSYVCTDLTPVNRIVWSEEGIAEAARGLGAVLDLDLVQRHLRESMKVDSDFAGYSMADVEKRQDGALAVRCIEFHAKPGRRGYDVTSSTVILQRSGDSIRIETN